MAQSRGQRVSASGRGFLGRSALIAVVSTLAVGMAGCALRTVEWQNRQPAQSIQRAAEPPGSVYAGWRVYQQRCAVCHGNLATGGDGVPDLTFRLRDIGASRFVDLVLRRYDWGLPAGSQGSPRETLIDDIVKRDIKGALQMPAWQGEPVVSAHIMDLYAYLSGRAQGTVAAGRPPR